MESSSDESFTWAKVSNDCEDSSNTSSPPKHDKMVSKTINDDLSPEKKSKKKSIKTERLSDEDSFNNVEKRKIKIESSSDNETKKRKTKKENKGRCYDSTEDFDDKDEEFLNMKVKEELDSSQRYKTKKKSKKRHHSNPNSSDEINESKDRCCDSTEDIDDRDEEFLNMKVKEELDSSQMYKTKKKSKKKHHSNPNSSDEMKFEVNHSDTEKQTKKKKKKRDSKLETEPIILTTEQKLADSPRGKKNKSNKQNRPNGRCDDIEDTNSPDNDISVSYDNYNEQLSTSIEDINNSKNDSKSKKSKSCKNFANGKDEESIEANNINLNNSIINQQNKHATPRIQFEDDVDSDEQSPKNLKESYSSQINKFLKSNPMFNPMDNVVNKVSEITQNDEIWILKCPNEVDLVNFSDKDLSIDSKTKIKLNGETYCGILDNESSSITIMTNEKDKYTMLNMVSNGIISLKKRLPKSHFAEDNIMENNLTESIPLPNTRCRHPLFGSDYRKAIKIPTSISHRLTMDTFTTETPERKKRKKHKKEIRSDDEITMVKNPKQEVIDETPVKRAKKRKQENDESTVKKTKRIKKEMNSSEVWESEKAIEENLFNF